MPIPDVMNAVTILEDERKSLAWQSVPCPEMRPEEVLVKVKATAVNRADLLQRRGLYPVPKGASPIMGLEVAGEIVACGASTVRWGLGDAVCCLLEGGGYAEYVTCHGDMLLPLPKGFDFAQGAALPEVFYTAYLNIYMEGEAAPGENVLVHAGASGVGTAAIQICRALGNPVFATASGSKLEALEKLGAQGTFDRHQGDFGEWLKEVTEGKGVDVILDPVGASYLASNVKALNKKGRLILIGFLGGAKTEVNLAPLLFKRIRIAGSVLRSRSRAEKLVITKAIREKIWPLFDTGELYPVIQTSMPITQVEEAHALLKSNETIGKIILTVGK